MADDNKKTIDELRQLNLLLEQQKTMALALNNIEQARANQAEISKNNEQIITELRGKGKNLTREQANYLKEVESRQKGINTELEKEKSSRKYINGILGEWNRQLKLGARYLMDSDKIIKSTILNLGMSGTKADLMRASFEQSAGYVARLGGNLEDVQNVMQGYAEETGRARVLSAQMVQDITAIGKGTGLGVEQAARLGAQFELMGFDARSTMEYVQGVVDTSERMGVNTTKVLKVVNDNFKKLNTYTFQQGVKGFAEMATYAEKFRIDITQALNAADIARSLEGAIDLAANLQIMGGEFAKTDPFEMLFLSRNDPAKFTEKIADMTKGVVTFRKMSDGSFEKFISPADRDRLAAVAKSLGMEVGALTEIAQRQAEIQRMRQQMSGMGLSEKERELVEGAAIFNKETGRFQVQVAGHMRDVTTLTKAQAEGLVQQSKSLEDRALEAQTFEEVLKVTINELKSALLPILRGINVVLTTVRPIIISITEWATKGSLGWLKVGALFLTVGGLWKGITIGLSGVAKGLKTAVASRVGGGLAPTLESKSGLFEQRKGIGMGAAAKGQGMKALGAGAGIGAAAAGIGVGIGAAASGISLLANAMSKLTKEQAENLKSIANTLAITFPVAAIGIAIVAAVAAPAAKPLMALGLALLMIGGAVGIAAAGIGFMGMGLSQLVTAGKDAGPAMMDVGKGIGMLSLAMMGFGASGLGFLVFAGTMKTLSKHAPALGVIGESFKQINAVLSGSKEDFLAVQNAVESISKMNVKGGGALTDLANMLKQPLKVEFTDKNLAVVSNITMEIDGQKIFQKSYSSNARVQRDLEVKNNQATG